MNDDTAALFETGDKRQGFKRARPPPLLEAVRKRLGEVR